MSHHSHNNKRKVYFPEGSNPLIAEIVCEIPNREDFTPEDHAALWFSKAEYQMSRSEAKMISHESVRYGFSKNLDGTFCEKSNNAQEKLQLWCSVSGDCRRGLERWANREHGEQRGKDQFQAVQAVLEAQDDMMGHHRHQKGKVDPEKLRKISHKVTRTARHFARMMGKADSYTVAHELENKKGSGENDETVATENSTVSSSIVGGAPVGSSSDSVLCDDAASVNSYSTTGTAISNHRMSGAVDEADRKDTTRPRFRRFGFGKQKNKADPAADEARVSRIA